MKLRSHPAHCGRRRGRRRGRRLCGVRAAAAASRRPSAPARSRTSPRRCWPRARRIADVPVYLDAVGNTRALNTVTVRAQVERADRQGRVPRRAGREARRRARRDRSAHLSGAIRPGGRQEGAGRGDARQCPHRSRSLHPARRLEFRIEAAGRYPEGAGGAARGAGAGRSGGDRQRPDDAELHPDRRADRRTHRPAAGRRRQSRAVGRCERHRGHHAGPADLGAVQPAAAAVSAGEQGLRARARSPSTRIGGRRPHRRSIAASCR